MRVGDLGTGVTKLRKSWKRVLERWQDTKPHWRDSVSRDFEKNYLAEFEPEILATLERMKTLAGMLETAAHECDK